MTADAIAEVVADLRASRVCHLLPDEEMNAYALSCVRGATVVDATAIYESLVENDKPVWVYEDHPNVAPSLESAAVCYVNEHGNVVVMQATAREHSGVVWDSENEIEWDRVRWVVETFMWLGGRSAAVGSLPTSGPVHLWRAAVYGSGEPADLRWYHLLPQYPIDHWDMAHLVLLGAMNFLACRNVALVEPVRPRALRRRIERTGVTVHTINVFPAGRSSRSSSGSTGQGVPLSSVRGHFATYGSEGRGLLFGKLAGRFWIPQYARGSAEHGRIEADYRLRTDSQ